MKKLCIIILICIILISSFFLLVKTNTSIYIGDYTGLTRYGFDITVKIDDKEIISDSLVSSMPCLPNFKIKAKLKYGLHNISIHSNEANGHQEENIFLLPNQYVYIEFFPADTLTFLHYNFPDSVIIKGIQLFDSIVEKYKLPAESDFPIENEKSGFLIENRFNPFYLE